MKAEMTGDGIITLYPETTLEAFALKHWREKSTINVEDFARCESTYWRGSKLLIGHTIPKDHQS
jgi:hypothetical protein